MKTTGEKKVDNALMVSGKKDIWMLKSTNVANRCSQEKQNHWRTPRSKHGLNPFTAKAEYK